MPKHKILFTGFPGFIGKRLVQEIQKQKLDSEFIFLVLPEYFSKAKSECKNLGLDSNCFEVVLGNIAEENLGLSPEQKQKIAQQATDIFHLAAIYDLAVPQNMAYKVNVLGTKHVVEFAKTISNLQRFVYYSTCYVAGDLVGTLYEDELPCHQKFKNHYEATKHEAEKIVRSFWNQVPTTIIRPSIVVGDSQTGETQKFDGPYFCMILIDKLKQFGIPLPYLGPSKAKANLVPVDFVINATIAIWQNPQSTGKCYALTDPNPVTARDIYEKTVKLLGGYGPWGTISPHLANLALSFKALRRFLGIPKEVLAYFNQDLGFDTKNIQNVLQSTGIICPSVDNYWPKIVNFYRKNKHRRELFWKVY